ncbi:MAG: helix-turn-helix transcriptional regulator [Bacteroidetes bacterium]|nr:helix-turn-helix transcriptional regulator [Bacteroidota bacterium]
MIVELIPIELSNTQTLQNLGLHINHREITVSEHIYLSLFEANYSSSLCVINRFENTKPHIGFNFCIEGSTNFALTGGYPTAHANSKKVNNFLMPTSMVTQELLLNPTLALLTLYIDLPAFIQLVGESLEALPFPFLDAMHTSDRCYFESYQWQAIIKNTLTQIFHSQMSPLAQRIFIESKSLELMAIILDIYAKGNQKQFTISKKDIDKIQFAKELLIRDLANPPSLSKLAREAGTNEFTLKKGFKEIFNVPVFKYLQQMRLAKAYELFQATNLQVSEVALIVGYESISSFNRAFMQFYGIKPTDVKRIPFRTI